jgi:hypothetical protein
MADHGNVAALPVNADLATPNTYSQDDPRRMELGQREKELALRIKQAIASSADIDPVSDFMYAQLALIDGDNTEASIHRVQHIQSLKEEYGLLDTMEDGKNCFADYIAILPRTLLSFAFCNESGQYVMVFDNTQFDGNRLNSKERIRAWVGGVYYLCQTLCPDFEAIRSGATLVFENEG